ncbi:PBSX family phage terminase large subunit [Paradesulfitobacterium aromaticivorans]
MTEIIKRVVKAALYFVSFSLKQKKILQWWCDGSPYKNYNGIIADGAIRAGKTVPMALSFIFWAMDTFDEQNFAMCGKSIGSFHRNVWKWLKPTLTIRGYRVQEVRTVNFITITFRGKTNYFYIFGGKDESSQDLIQGITLAGILFDEVALMPESFVNQGTGRCSVKGAKWWFNCNPDAPLHWFKIQWLDKAREKKILHLHFIMDDNPSLDEETKEKYKLMYFGVFFKRFILGLWLIAEGAIYDMWSDEENLFNDDEMPLGLKYLARRSIAIDYGTTNPMVFLDIWDDGKTVWQVDEYYYDSKEKGAQKTDSQYADDLIEFIGNDIPDEIILDPSAASFKAELRQRGLRVKDADNEVNDGIRVTSSMIGLRLYRVHEKCIHTREEITSYAWDEKARLRGEEKPVKVKDHTCDGVRYFCKTKIKARRLVS